LVVPENWMVRNQLNSEKHEEEGRKEEGMKGRKEAMRNKVGIK